MPEERYVAALVADLEQALPQVWGRRVYSVFFGGGTPSLFSARGIDAILAAVRARLPLAADAEITLEANPGTFEAEKFRDFRAAGVNRLSIGVQSFNPAHLKALGRIHDDAEARRAIEIAQARFRQHEPRPDVRIAGTDGRRRRGPTSRRRWPSTCRTCRAIT